MVRTLVVLFLIRQIRHRSALRTKTTQWHKLWKLKVATSNLVEKLSALYDWRQKREKGKDTQDRDVYLKFTSVKCNRNIFGSTSAGIVSLTTGVLLYWLPGLRTWAYLFSDNTQEMGPKIEIFHFLPHSGCCELPEVWGVEQSSISQMCRSDWEQPHCPSCTAWSFTCANFWCDRRLPRANIFQNLSGRFRNFELEKVSLSPWIIEHSSDVGFTFSWAIPEHGNVMRKPKQATRHHGFQSRGSLSLREFFTELTARLCQK